MSADLVASAIAGNRSFKDTGPAEFAALMFSNHALNNPHALAQMVAHILGQEPLGGKIIQPDLLDVFLAGIALGRAAGFPAARAKRSQGFERSREIRDAVNATIVRLQAEGKSYNKTTIISLVAQQLNVGKRTVERALAEDDPF
jgi:hypothetical protein